MKKKFLIILIFVLLCCLGGIVGFWYYKNNSSITGEEWGDLYFDYLEKAKFNQNSEKENNNSNDSQSTNQEDTSFVVGFIESSNYQEPVMYYVYSDGVDNRIQLCSIEDNHVQYKTNISTPYEVDVQLMYDVSNKEYKYYVHQKQDTADNYVEVDTILKDPSDYSKELNVKQDGTVYIEGKNKTAKELIVDPKVEEMVYTVSDNRDDLKKKMKDSVQNFKKIDKIVDNNVKKVVDDTLKQKEEENPKDEVKKDNSTIQVGDYTLKYGHYKACVEDYCQDFILNEDKTAIYNGESYYFHVGDVDFAQGPGYGNLYVHPAIIISKTPDGDGFTYTPYGTSDECLMTDGDMQCVNYVGE